MYVHYITILYKIRYSIRGLSVKHKSVSTGHILIGWDIFSPYDQLFVCLQYFIMFFITTMLTEYDKTTVNLLIVKQ